MNINKNFKAALIGCGKFGIGSHKNNFNHLSVINKFKLINLVAICDLHKVNLKNLIKINFYHNIKKLFKSNKINLAIITTDNLSHFKILNICIKEKIKFIICEKPLAMSYNDYLKISKSKALILTNYSRRHSIEFLNLKKKIKKNYLGNINYINITFNRGVINNGCHYFDLLCWLFGDKINITDLNLKKSKHLKKDYYGFINLNVGTTHISLNILDEYNLGYENIEIFGSKGKIHITDGKKIKFYFINKNNHENNFYSYKLRYIRQIDYQSTLSNFYKNFLTKRVIKKNHFFNDSLFINILKKINKNEI